MLFPSYGTGLITDPQTLSMLSKPMTVGGTREIAQCTLRIEALGYLWPAGPVGQMSADGGRTAVHVQRYSY